MYFQVYIDLLVSKLLLGVSWLIPPATVCRFYWGQPARSPMTFCTANNATVNILMPVSLRASGIYVD